MPQKNSQRLPLTDDTLVREEIKSLIQELKKHEETMYE